MNPLNVWFVVRPRMDPDGRWFLTIEEVYSRDGDGTQQRTTGPIGRREQLVCGPMPAEIGVSMFDLGMRFAVTGKLELSPVPAP